MKKITLILIPFLICNFSFAQLQHQWSLNAEEYVAGNAAYTEFPNYEEMVTDSNGNSYIYGKFSAALDFDPSPGATVLSAHGSFSDLFLAKYDSLGNLVFAKQIGGTANVLANTIAIDGSSNIILSGQFSGIIDFDMGSGTSNLSNLTPGNDAFIAKYDSNGNFIFVKQFEDPVIFIDLKTDGSGNIYATGNFAGTIDFDPSGSSALLSSLGSQDIFIAKYDLNGNYLFAKQIGGTGYENVAAISLSTNGIYITGTFSGTVDFDPGIGTVNLTNAGGNIFIAKYSLLGVYTFAKCFGTSTNGGGATVKDIEVSGSTIFLLGSFSGTVDFNPATTVTNLSTTSSEMFLCAYSSVTGGLSFAEQIVANGTALKTVGSTIWVTGTFTGTVDFDPGTGIVNLTTTATNTFVTGYTAAGIIYYAQKSSTIVAGFSPAIGSDAYGNVYVTSKNNFMRHKYNGGTYFNVQYTNAPGGTAGADAATSVIRDATGNSYVTGTFRGSLNFAGSFGFTNLTSLTTYSGFFAKYDATGNCLFAKQLGGTVDPSAIAIDTSGNIYVTGKFYGTADFDPGALTANLTSAYDNAFFAKYDVNGNYIFAKQIADNSASRSNDILIDASGNIYIAGCFYETADFDPTGGTSLLVSNGSSDLYFAKYNPSGNLLFVKQIGGINDDEAKSITFDGSNNIFITGAFTGTVDFDPNGGTVNLTTSSSAVSTFFAKYSNAGNLLFAKQIGGATYSDVKSNAMAVDNSGNCYITGQYKNTIDFDPSTASAYLTSGNSYNIFIAKYNSLGNYVYAKQIGGSTGLQVVKSISVDASGNANITGSFSGTVDFDPGANNTFLASHGGNDIFIARYNTLGDIIYAKNIGGTGDDVGNSIYTNNAGVVTYVGSFTDSADFNPDNSLQTMLTAFANPNLQTNTDLFVSQYLQSFFTTTSTIVKGSISCFGDTDGSAYVIPTGNQPPYTYLWSPSGITDSSATTLPGGLNTITVTDNFGLTITETINIAQPSAPLTATLTSQSNVTCYGGTNGYALITPLGGTAPYSYSWSPLGGATNSSSILSANTYTVTVTDNNGCQTTVTFTITQPPQLHINTVSQLNVSCYGGSNGSATVSATGGSGNNTFSWSPVTTSGPTATSLTAGNYNASVTDLNGCLAQTTVIISQPALLTGIISSITNVTCASATDGAATVSGNGGTSPYSYLWSPSGGNNSTANNLPIGNYTVTITDLKGCTSNTPVSILNLIPLQEICVVTADSATGNYNVVIWEKPGNISNIDSFYIYREISLGNFQKIGAVHKDSLSLYNDYTANPNSTNYKYKIKVLDTCGSIGNYGLFHNSIHLQYLSLGNFQWTYYEIENTANQVASYNFYRADNSTANFVLLQIIPGGNNSYTDVNYASYPNARYRVDVNWLSGISCSPTRQLISTTRSNIRHQNVIVSGIVTADESTMDFSIYPNPANDHFNIELFSLKQNAELKIIDVLGQIVYVERVSASTTKTVKQINTNNFSKGIYFVIVETGAKKVIKKVVIN